MSLTTQDKSFAYRVVGDLMVFVHSDQSPTDGEWRHIVDRFKHTPNLKDSRVLVVTYGGAPNARQRAEANEILRRGRPRIAVLTASALTRAAATAMSWFIPTLRAFALEDQQGAFEHLQTSEPDRKLLRDTLRELDAELRRSSGIPRPQASR